MRIKVNRRFGVTCSRYIQCRRVIQAREQREADRKQSSNCCLRHAGFLLGLLFNPEDGHDMYLWNFGRLLSTCTESYPRGQNHLIHIYLWLYSPLLDLGHFYRFLVLYIVGRTSLTGISPSQNRYLHTGQHKDRINANTHIHVLSGTRTHDRAKTVHAVDRATAVTDNLHMHRCENLKSEISLFSLI
jgi:hypothetical protein